MGVGSGEDCDTDSAPSSPNHWTDRHRSLIAGAVWAAVWATLLWTGQAYRMRTLYAGWQTLPIEDLSKQPFTSVWYLHIQPPLWNLLLGIVEGWLPFDSIPTQEVLSVSTGALLAATICSLLSHLGAAKPTGWVLTAVATGTNQVFAYAFSPRYDTLTMLLVAATVWSVARAESRGLGRGRWAVPVVIATALVMTRTIFHPLLLAILVGYWIWRWRDRLDTRRIAALVALPIVVVGGWLAKNQVMFGSAELSSWSGMNLLRSVEPAVEPERIAELAEDDRISGVAVAGPFRAYGSYAEYVPVCLVPADAPAVMATDTRRIPESAIEESVFAQEFAVNFNFECYLDVYPRAGADARAIIVHDPGAWFTARAWSLNNWVETGTDSATDRSALWPAIGWFSNVALFAVPHPGLPKSWEDNGLWVHANQIALTTVLASIAVVVATIRGRRGGRGSERSVRIGHRVTMATASILIVWTFVVGVVFELGEQSRFRNTTDPIALAIGGLIIWRWASSRWTTSRWARHRNAD